MIPYTKFIHPEDQAALDAMKAIPGFDALLKKFMRIGYEQCTYGTNMASSIRLSPTQLPDIYGRVARICGKLSIPVPEVYLKMHPAPNAWTSGDTRIFMTMTSGLFDYLADDEIDSVIAHECGHIVCHHVLYHTMAQWLKAGVGGLFDTLTKPLEYAILYWSRKSELSADRAAAMVCGVDALVRSELRLAGGGSKLTRDVNIDEWIAQAEEYETLRAGGLWDRTLQTIATLNLDHPFAAVRVREAVKWSQSDDYRILRFQMESGEGPCPHCGAMVKDGWEYCRSCGRKVR